jgi:chloramphenicol 3-O phosphotransferase
MASVIFLHGASSSGKSTLARAVQAELPRPFWHLSIDHFRDSGAWPMDRFQTSDLAWSAHRTRYFQGFHATLAAVVGAGNDLIIEHILDTPGWLDTLRGLLSPHDVLFVGIHCDLALLDTRERARGDRQIGSARRDQGRIHQGLRYDLELNGANPVAQNVALVRGAWRSGRRNSSFSQ